MTAHRFDLRKRRMSTLDLEPSAAHHAMARDRLYVVVGTTLRLIDGGALVAGLWRSRRFVSAWPVGFGWAKVAGPFTHPVTVRYFVEGALVYETTVSSRRPFRVPGDQGRALEIEIESQGVVTSLALTDNGDEVLTP